VEKNVVSVMAPMMAIHVLALTVEGRGRGHGRRGQRGRQPLLLDLLEETV
jgi:hypothetical protein